MCEYRRRYSKNGALLPEIKLRAENTMRFSRTIKGAKLGLFFAVASFAALPVFAASSNVQIFPLTAPDLGTPCPTGQIRAWAWDGSTQTQCIPLPPTCPAGSALNFTTSTSSKGIKTGVFSCKTILSGVYQFYNTNGTPASNGCNSNIYALCPANSVVIGMDACSNGGTSTATVAVLCEALN